MMQSRVTPIPLAVLLVSLLTLALTGCTVFLPRRPIDGSIPKRAGNPESTAKVGEARVDLTPTPGIAMNYSLNGRLSRGFWGRLYARSVYLQDSGANALVFVSVDLPHIPNGLHDRVAELVSKNASLDHLGREQIIVAATHAHNSAENYFSDPFYNGMVSARSGFDPFLFEFLAGRIADAIARSYEKRVPLTGVKYRSARLDGFFRNRSLGAFLANRESAAFIAEREAAGISGSCTLVAGQTDARACWAVRARVEVVDLFTSPSTSGGNDELLTSMVFLAVHPTVLGPETEVFQADLLGVTAALLEQQRLSKCVSRGYKPKTVALFNGAQGDVSVTWSRRDRYELLNEDTSAGARQGLAVQLAEFICGANPGIDPETGDYAVDLHFQFERIPLANRSSIDLEECAPWTEKCTAKEPLPGIPSMGGAEDGRTFWYELGAQEGLRSAARHEHGRKAIGFESFPLARLVANPDNPPKQVPLGVYRIGGLVFATLPGEFTTMLGERIRNAVGTAVATGDASERVILIGLANGHVSYVTTPEEYDLQAYEGAQNLYGAATGPLLAGHYEELGKALNTSSATLAARSYDYDTGVCRVFQPQDAGAASFLADDGLQNILVPLDPLDQTSRDFKQQCWVDAIPKLSELSKPSSQCTRAVPYVWIEKKSADPDLQCKSMFGSSFLERPCDAPHPKQCVVGEDPRYCLAGTVPQDNCGLEIVTALHGVYEDRTRWCSFWMPPAGTDPADFVFCAAGVTDEDVIAANRSVEGLPLDLGDSGLTGFVNRHRECCGTATRPVCEFPEP